MCSANGPCPTSARGFVGVLRVDERERGESVAHLPELCPVPLRLAPIHIDAVLQVRQMRGDRRRRRQRQNLGATEPEGGNELLGLNARDHASSGTQAARRIHRVSYCAAMSRRQPAPAGHDIGGGVVLVPTGQRWESPTVTWVSWRFRRSAADGGIEIGGVDYAACHLCRQVLLGEIGLVGGEQNQGLGRRGLEVLRADLFSYRWYITPPKPRSRTFWERLAQAHPGEYCPPAADLCPHLQEAT